MSHLTKNNKSLLTRIRRIKGQTEALEKVFNDDVDCASVLQQIAAIRGAVNGLMEKVLEEHIREHLGSQILDNKSRDQDVEQVISVLRSYLK